jgi:precorrin-8X/cobalt-precorrin-8 methylmutase
MDLIKGPVEIEKRSFEIITEGLAGRQFDPQDVSVIKRVIHTTADFDYADNLVFSKGASAIAKDVIKSGVRIVTDTQMAKAGINKKAAEQLGCSVHCFIDAPEIIESARASGQTRARVAVDHAAETLETPIIYVVGNAPTALIRLYELIHSSVFEPALIIGVPVGFVNVVESKELIMGLNVPSIVAKGRKGGSNVAAAICNALFYEIIESGGTKI